MSFIYKLLRNKWYPPADPTHSLRDRTVLVTGANTGLGYHAALKLAQLGARRLILGVRSLDKGHRAARTIRHLAADESCTVDVWEVDMLSPKSVRAFADRVDEELSGGGEGAVLHAAVLNAGVYKPEFERAETTGWEVTLQTNVLSTSLLALMLLPVLARAQGADWTPTLEFVNSGGHYRASLPEGIKHDPDVNVLDAYNKPEGYTSRAQYLHSKLFLMYATRGMIETVAPSGDVCVTSVCPGACQSDLPREQVSKGWVMRFAAWMASTFFLRTTEEGSRTLVSGLFLGREGHGKFWQNDIFRE